MTLNQRLLFLVRKKKKSTGYEKTVCTVWKLHLSGPEHQCFIMRIDPKMNMSGAQYEPEGQKDEIFAIILPFTSSQKSWFVKHSSGSLKPTPAFGI